MGPHKKTISISIIYHAQSKSRLRTKSEIDSEAWRTEFWMSVFSNELGLRSALDLHLYNNLLKTYWVKVKHFSHLRFPKPESGPDLAQMFPVLGSSQGCKLGFRWIMLWSRSLAKEESILKFQKIVTKLISLGP